MSKLLSALITFRDTQAAREGVEDFKVLQYKTLQEIARVWPTTFTQLSEIKGIGPAKLKKYGEKILEIVQEYANGEGDASVRSGSDLQSPTSSVWIPDYSGMTEKESGMTKVKITQTPETVPSGNITVSKMTREEKESADVSQSKSFVSSESGHNLSKHEKQTVSVSEYLDYLNLVFQKTADVRIRGEISASKTYPAGVYFTLKDKEDESPLSCFLPKFTIKGLGLPIEDGMEVCVEGMPRMVKRSGRFLFTVENMELVGEGAIKKAYEILKAKLDAEGLFVRKRELPQFITKIGVVTSRAGAVIHDFRNNLEKRGFQVFLKDVRVEGASSSGMIIEAVKYFNDSRSVIPTEGLPKRRDPSLLRRASHSQGFVPDDRAVESNRVDVIIVMRGGGSLEDMQSFNNESVVREIFASRIPTIVAIGHDRDVPLAQLAADLQVSTPTAAAHAVNSSWNILKTRLPELETQLMYMFSDSLSAIRQKLSVSTQVVSGEVGKIFLSFRKYKDSCLSFADKHLHWLKMQESTLKQNKLQILTAEQNSLNALLLKINGFDKLLTQANPERQLSLGYALVRSRGQLLRKVSEVKSGDELETQVSDGRIKSIVE